MNVKVEHLKVKDVLLVSSSVVKSEVLQCKHIQSSNILNMSSIIVCNVSGTNLECESQAGDKGCNILELYIRPDLSKVPIRVQRLVESMEL